MMNRPMISAGAASDASQHEPVADRRLPLVHRHDRAGVGMEAEQIAERDRGEDQERRRERVGEEGHPRRDRHVAAHRQAEQGRADDLDAGDQEEDADEQPHRHAARNRPAGEAPELAGRKRVPERPDPAALGHLGAGRHVGGGPAVEPGGLVRLSHAASTAGPARASSPFPSHNRACRGSCGPWPAPARPSPGRAR